MYRSWDAPGRSENDVIVWKPEIFFPKPHFWHLRSISGMYTVGPYQLEMELLDRYKWPYEVYSPQTVEL